MTASDEDRRAIRQAAADFCRAATEGDRVVAAMTGEHGYDPQTWDRMAQELGWVSIVVPEHLGGLGLTFAEAAIVLGEAGRAMLPSPLLPTLAMTQVLAHTGTDAALDILQKTCPSGGPITLAAAETAFASTTSLSTRVEGPADAPLITGRKQFVLHGDSAAVFLVTAADQTGLGLYVVDGNDPGITRTPRMTLDQTRRLATVSFDNARAIRLGGADAVAYAENVMLVALAAEAAEAADECLSRTVAYLNLRTQFGRALATFQALRHRCAALAVKVQGALAVARAAVDAVVTSAPNLPVLAPMARLVCGDVFMLVAGEMIQLHGGIGFTYEHPAHLYLKRAKSTQLLFGTSEELRDRVGRLAGI